MVKKKQHTPQRRRVATKNGNDYQEIIYEDKPVCPECNLRDYKVVDYDIQSEGMMKFYAHCNNCNYRFIYIKSLTSVFANKEGDKS